MKITNIETYLHYSVWRNLILVKVETDEGITGIGEATLRNHEVAIKSAIDAHITPYILGESPYIVSKLFDKFFSKDAWRGGAVFLSAISGIEIALWDIIGKKAGQPIYNLIGGKHHQRIRTYANGWFRDCKTSDDYVQAAKKVVARGFTALKWDPLFVHQVDGSTREREVVETALKNIYDIRAAVGKDIGLCIELHGALSYDGAVMMANNVVDADVMFIEEPMHPDDKEGFRKLSMKSMVPIAGGERVFTRWGYKSFIAEHYHSIAQPDLTHVGGIWETKLLGAMLESAYIQIAPHNSNGIVA
ncbi:MAG: mandelate racemase/muconate lactonizing enzyme family protein, partial [Oscillospiraceae bacterium]|nr:mandelate racemase/muconate lactonizing enzyme family protein [Oscillospiraceae bacterium]